MNRLFRPLITPLLRPALSVVRRGGAAPVEKTLGPTGVGGAGNWPTGADRALLSFFSLLDTANLVSFNMRTTSANVGGDRFKGLVYAADGGAGPAGSTLPSTLLAVSAASAVVGDGAQLVTMALSGTIAPQDIWIGYVCDGGSVNGETESGETNPGWAIMLDGILSYTSPDDPAPVWPGSPGPYANTPASWIVYN